LAYCSASDTGWLAAVPGQRPVRATPAPHAPPYRDRRDALLDALHQHFGDTAAVHGAGTGMHLSLRFAEPAWRDDRISEAAHAAGIVAH
jgi:DNA-binding transcriptional MocR family regulator